MEKPFILHLFTATPNASPFDINMAYDAGYNAVVPYGNVTLEQIAALTQDAIFSRGPKGVKRTGIFIGGREIGLAADMLDAAKRAMVPPFEVSVFADPSGAFTTAAGMVACVEQQLKKVHQTTLAGKNIVVLAGTGPVGAAAAVLASQARAHVWIASHTSAARARMTSEVVNARYGANTQPGDASADNAKRAMIQNADIILGAAKAGVQVLSAQELVHAKKLLVVADVNAVPPSGIEGVAMMDNGTPLAAGSGKAVAVGALAIGNIKYQTQRGLLETMIAAENPLYIDFRDAFAAARKLTA
ncbi:MAG: NAD(P)-dependent methylenetetrahydromethanopterin dehydrogenase [Burkholderiales bacterium]